MSNTINQFLGRYEAFIDPDQHENFRRDFWAVIDKLGDDRFRQVAIEVLGDIEGAELKMYDQELPEGYVDGRIVWGQKGLSEETGTIISYSKAYGQQGGDWLMLLKCIAKNSLRNG